MAYAITNLCIGCGVCRRICPTEAIRGQREQRHRIEAERCIDCGACGRICPHGSIKDPGGLVCQRIRIRSKWPRPIIDLERCMACTICVEACPTSCIELRADRGTRETVRRPFLKKERNCIGCAFCSEECPVDAIAMDG